MERVFTTPLRSPAGENVLYADIPYILLGLVAERVSGQPLDALADTVLFHPLHMSHTSFYPERLRSNDIAPTEHTDQEEIVGKAHDEKARILHEEGLITGHAGLFSIVEDLLTYCHMILNKGVWEGKQYLTPRTIRLMQTEVARGNDLGFSLGWTTHASYMEPGLPKGIFSKSGFTGTLIVISPDTHCALVLLTNRTYPNRPHTPAAINGMRRELINLVFS